MRRDEVAGAERPRRQWQRAYPDEPAKADLVTYVGTIGIAVVYRAKDSGDWAWMLEIDDECRGSGRATTAAGAAIAAETVIEVTFGG